MFFIIGISYLSRDQEDEALKRLESTADNKFMEFDDEPLVRMSDILFTHRMKLKFKAWLEKLLQMKCKDSTVDCSEKELNQQFETIFYKMRPAIVLSGFTFYQLRLVQMVMIIFILATYRKYFSVVVKRLIFCCC